MLRGWDNFIYNAAKSTTHAVTTHAIFFKTMLSYKRLHIITTPVTCTKQSPTRQLGPTLSLARGLCRILTSLSLCGSYPRLPGREKLWTTASFPYLFAGSTQPEPMRPWYFYRTSDVTLGDYGCAVGRSL